MIRRRFFEYEYLKRKILNNSEYITEQQATEMLDNMNTHFDDLTFIFIPLLSGWKTKIICNNTDNEISVNDIGPVASEWFVKQLKDLTLQRIKNNELVAV